MKFNRTRFFALLCAALLCGSPSPALADAAPSGGLSVANLDPTCPACSDFFTFATGGYAKTHTIPPDRSYMGTVADMREQSLADQRTVIEAALAAHPSAASVEGQVAAFYSACMDTQTIERLGAAPLKEALAPVDAVTDRSALPKTLAVLQRKGYGGFFNVGSQTDEKNSAINIMGVRQGGLGLPDRDYYTRTDPKSQAVRAAYLTYMTGAFSLLGESPDRAASDANAVFSVESALAKASRSNVDMRDPDLNYNITPLGAFEASAPAFAWGAFFRDVGASDFSKLNVGQPAYFAAFNAIVAAGSLPDLKAYLRWRVIRAAPLALPEAFDDLSFAYSMKLTGAKVQRPRWKRCVESTGANLGEALGQLYVAKYFTPDTKARASTMVDNIIAALRADLTTLAWMSPATRAAALAKLDAMTKKIGYPSKWKSYTFAVEPGRFFKTLANAQAFETAFDLAKVDKPVDRTEWALTPQTINAYYNADYNEIVFPAAILQPPVFSATFDDATNYGAIGSVIGHEMTHGFDDQGRKFDAQGNLRDWWTPDDAMRYTARAECVRKQFDALVAVDDVKQNGKLVLGEAIADLGGLKLAYAAFLKTPEAKANVPIDGYTPEQRFFLGFATFHTWYWRPEFARLIAQTDPHPIDKNRVNATVSNMPEFAAAFHCSSTSPMVRGEAMRCAIW